MQDFCVRAGVGFHNSNEWDSGLRHAFNDMWDILFIRNIVSEWRLIICSTKGKGIKNV